MKTINELAKFTLNVVANWYARTSGLALSQENKDVLRSLVNDIVIKVYNLGTLATLNDMNTDLIMRLYVDGCRGEGVCNAEYNYTHAKEAAAVFMEHYQADLEKKAQAEITKDK